MEHGFLPVSESRRFDRSDWKPGWDALRRRHLDTAHAFEAAEGGALHLALEHEFLQLAEDLQALARGDGDAAELTARVHGCGELLSSRLVQAALGEGWRRLDARDVLVVQPG